MASRRRIKPVLNLANIRKPVKEEKPVENVPATKIDSDENQKLFKLPPQDSDNTSHLSKEKEFSHIEAGCQSPTKLKYSKIRPNVPSSAATPTPSEDHEIRPILASGLNRIRTESVSSTKSSVFNFHNRDRKESNRIRQISRCEEKEKVVESKREIKTRYANPDKMRLTMFDMIYYNPTGNPMQKKPAMKPITDTKDLSKVSTNSTLSPTKADVKVELRRPKEEELSTVPQLKLGPNGEIILDEKSLTIENVKEKEAREQIANSKIQYDDEYSNNYGYYKRQKRTKDWPADETVKFYKCLHTVGTDFSLMLSLFPKRSRRDLKLKYKKEERQNPSLVNKALLHPKLFNIEELEEELKQEEAVKNEIAAKEALKVQQDKATRAPKRTAQIGNSKSKMPQKKVSNAMRMMTDGNEVYGSVSRSTRVRKRKPTAPKVTTTTMEQYKEPEICLPIIVHPPVRYVEEYPTPMNDEYCPNYTAEESKQVLNAAPVEITQSNGLEVSEKMEHEPVDSKIGINHEIGYITSYESYHFPLSPTADEMIMMMPPPSSTTPSRIPASPARSIPPQSPRSAENNPLNNLSELELDSLVLVESQDPNSKNTHFEVYIMEENGEMSEKPLDLSPDVIESIRLAMMNDS